MAIISMGRLASLAAAALALAACGKFEVPMAPPVPASEGTDPAVSESPIEAGSIMTCDTIATERAGIAGSLQRLSGSDAAAALRQRDAALARLAAQKHCPAPAL